MQISEGMLTGQLIQIDESIPPVLMHARMYCLGCPASQGESLEEAYMVRGVDCDALVPQVSKIPIAKA